MHHIALGLILSVLVTAPCRAADIVVQVLNMADAAGSVRVRVCTEAEWLKDCNITAEGPARAGVSTVIVPNVPPGIYGIIAHHDSDGDGEVNRNLLGIPTEGVGFSRDATLRFGAPKFSDAALQIGSARVQVPITLHFEHATSRR